MYDILIEPLVRNLRIDIAKEIRRFGCERVLDMCCGTGSQLKYINGYGVDISWGMIRHSIKKGVRCVLSDATKTPFKKSLFDAIVIEFALHEKPHEVRMKIIDEMRRLLKADGHVFILDYSLPRGLKGKFIHFIEWLAGGEHYKNYKDFLKRGGIDYISKNFLVVKEKSYFDGNVKLVIGKKKKI